MAKINKPDMQNLWASGGAVIAPEPSKIQQGWTAEIPPHQWENFVQLRQDTYLAYLGQQGIPEWDATTEYQPNSSFVQYDGKIYLALTLNTNSQPDTNPLDWKDFVTNSLPTAVAGGTANALTVTFEEPVALANGLTVIVRALLANTNTTPTLDIGSGAKTIVKGSNKALMIGDIAGPGHWVEFQFDTTLDKWVLQNPAKGVSVQGATGGGTDAVFYENDTTVTQSYTITSGKNAVSAGPITINGGATVTVPDGSVWTIV